MHTLWQDLRYGARMLRTRPGFTLVAVLSLALGIGATTTIFSLLSAVQFRPLPYREPDRLILVCGENLKQNRFGDAISFPDLLDLRKQGRVFEELGAATDIPFAWTGIESPERLDGMVISASMFRLLGVAPLAGRFFLPEEDRPGAEPVAVLSHSFWQRRFLGDRGLLGRALKLNGQWHTVIGIMPPEFTFYDNPSVWTPLAPYAYNLPRKTRHFLTIGRLRPGVTISEAQTELRDIASQLERDYPETNAGWNLAAINFRGRWDASLQRDFWRLLGAVSFVLLIACANIANLLLARAVERQKEMAVRAALGASRFRLVRMLLCESALLAGLGGALGVLLAFWGIDLVVAIGDLPEWRGFRIDERALGFAVGISWLTGILSGLAPALEASQPNLRESLKDAAPNVAGGRRGKFLRRGLVVGEIACALVLLTGAGLLIRSFLFLQYADLGMRPKNVLIAGIPLDQPKYDDRRQVALFHRQLMERIGSLPGAHSAAAVGWSPSFTPPGAPPGGRDEMRLEGSSGSISQITASIGRLSVDPEYFRIMGIPLVKGRHFTPQDADGASSAAIASELTAQRLWPGQDPLGRRLRIGDANASGQWLTVVGVVSDIRWSPTADQFSPLLYVPFGQFPSKFSLYVRAEAAPLSLVPSMRAAVAAVDPEVVVPSFGSSEEGGEGYASGAWFYAVLLGSFAICAMLLAAMGIYAVMAYSVRQRTREFGVRLALGAQPGDLLRLVIKQGMALALIGVGLGICGAVALTRLLRSLIYGVSATDPVTFALVALLLAGVALLACWIPARRATKVDPMIALRCV